MGQEQGKINPEKMPKYYVENASLDVHSCGILIRSLRNVCGTKEIFNSSARVPFSVLYDYFYDRIRQIKDEDVSVMSYIDNTMQEKSLFLARLLKLLVTLPQNMVVTQSKKQKQHVVDRISKRELKKFAMLYRDVHITCYGPIGEALFYAVLKCDELYTVLVEMVWTDAYSMLLKFLIPVISQIQKSSLGYDMSSDAYSSQSDADYQGFDIDGKVDSFKGTFSRFVLKKVAPRTRRSISRNDPYDYVRRHLRNIIEITEAEMHLDTVKRFREPDKNPLRTRSFTVGAFGCETEAKFLLEYYGNFAHFAAKAMNTSKKKGKGSISIAAKRKRSKTLPRNIAQMLTENPRAVETVKNTKHGRNNTWTGFERLAKRHSSLFKPKRKPKPKKKKVERRLSAPSILDTSMFLDKSQYKDGMQIRRSVINE